MREGHLGRIRTTVLVYIHHTDRSPTLYDLSVAEIMELLDIESTFGSLSTPNNTVNARVFEILSNEARVDVTVEIRAY